MYRKHIKQVIVKIFKYKIYSITNFLAFMFFLFKVHVLPLEAPHNDNKSLLIREPYESNFETVFDYQFFTANESLLTGFSLMLGTMTTYLTETRFVLQMSR